MIIREGDDVIFTCDFCSNYIDTSEDDFDIALSDMKGHGWVVFRQAGEWLHKCPACQAGCDDNDFEDLT